MDEYHYEEVSLEEMIVEGGKLLFPCPCGDLFELLLTDFFNGSDVAQCPTCSLTVKIIFTDEQKGAFLAQHSTASATAVAV
ncbi:diphthamide biosynthesis protein 3 [Angomonas deanei]|uniref:CSL zinc finger containing protein, putative n=1 Tax=Angomonas deanei TaxID=59799 RepID=S9VR91_9TRYP|nr:diphthamide biosynthesis protein 3 [Angomonas deanei]EPY43414.1 diphthamide biosynthesis protein 3 [Angomonas deanei]CAD2221358.1 CSL zinc finger containing protein, putative [Angomonas deanei]|eukprot:EPY40869.1 diphthamide biosynthesis protein 3 [Angomonas deanei]